LGIISPVRYNAATHQSNGRVTPFVLPRKIIGCDNNGSSRVKELWFKMTFRTPNKVFVAGSLILLLGSIGIGARKMQRLGNGTWGGQHIQFEVSDGSVNIEYDCAHGSIAGPLTVDRQGRFSWRGTYTGERGGPIRLGQKVEDQAATYSGSLTGNTMTLKVKLENSNIEPQTFTLVRDKVGRVFKCK
jgi:hypothetical protein